MPNLGDEGYFFIGDIGVSSAVGSSTSLLLVGKFPAATLI